LYLSGQWSVVFQVPVSVLLLKSFFYIRRTFMYPLPLIIHFLLCLVLAFFILSIFLYDFTTLLCLLALFSSFWN
jgi:hypothetical protein